MKRYSQNNEQDLILAHFGAARGTFLDIGANDGETLSNSRALAELGWAGVCVEPSPTAYAALERLYAGHELIECHNVAICNGEGPAILHESGPHLGAKDHGLLSTVVPTEMDRWKNTSNVFTPTSVECITFYSLIQRSQYSTFEFITIDAEGMDYDILFQIDLRVVDCRMLIVEYNGIDEHRYVQYCREYGMSLRHKNAENLVFTR